MNMKFPLAALVLALAGCASGPQVLRGEFSSQDPQQAAADGSRVRWGGSVIAVEPQAGRTCFQVLSRELSRSGRPRNVDASQGRFLACRQGFYDPAVFTSGREVTVVGNVAGSEARTVGEFKLELPRIEAETIYLWPQRVDAYYYDRPDWIWWSSGYRGWFGPSMRPHRVPQPRPQEPRPGG